MPTMMHEVDVSPVVPGDVPVNPTISVSLPINKEIAEMLKVGDNIKVEFDAQVNELSNDTFMSDESFSMRVEMQRIKVHHENEFEEMAREDEMDESMDDDPFVEFTP